MRIAVVFLLAMGLAGCGSISPAPVPVSTTPAAGLPYVAQCQAKGGEIRPVCRRGTPTCVILHADAGRGCSDSSQCEGRCVVNPEGDIAIPATGKVTGICEADSDPCGCSAEIIAGVAQSARCVD